MTIREARDRDELDEIVAAVTKAGGAVVALTPRVINPANGWVLSWLVLVEEAR